MVNYHFLIQQTVLPQVLIYFGMRINFLGIGTSTPESQLHIKQGTYNEFGLLLTSPELPPNYIDPNPPKFGSSIGFVSNVGSGTNS